MIGIVSAPWGCVAAGVVGFRASRRWLLMPVAAFGVHQLRYYLAYGSAAGAMLQRTGHSYLHSVVPWLVVLIAAALGGFLGALGRAVAGQRTAGRYSASLLGLWIACTVV